MWDTKTGDQVTKQETNSQVCAMVWSKHTNELVSSHGFEKNQITVWNYNAHQNVLKPVADLIGH